MINPDILFGRLGNRMFQQAYLYARVRDGTIADFYLQSEKYFKDYANEIKEMYSDGINNLDYVAIHVRRGDYVNNPFYVDLMNTDYYQKAMALFPEAEFMVFSDDSVWCREQEIFKDCFFCISKGEIQDLNAMASCKAVITANSSYSWWGGYLSKGKVVTPSQWFSDGIQRCDLPESWIKL